MGVLSSIRRDILSWSKIGKLRLWNPEGEARKLGDHLHCVDGALELSIRGHPFTLAARLPL